EEDFRSLHSSIERSPRLHRPDCHNTRDPRGLSSGGRVPPGLRRAESGPTVCRLRRATKGGQAAREFCRKVEAVIHSPPMKIAAVFVASIIFSVAAGAADVPTFNKRSEEHTSELQ